MRTNVGVVAAEIETIRKWDRKPMDAVEAEISAIHPSGLAVMWISKDSLRTTKQSLSEMEWAIEGGILNHGQKC